MGQQAQEAAHVITQLRFASGIYRFDLFPVVPVLPGLKVAPKCDFLLSTKIEPLGVSNSLEPICLYPIANKYRR